MGKHAIPKYVVKADGEHFIVVFSESERRVPGTPKYMESRHAQGHADRLNKSK